MDKIIASIATIPGRENTLRETVKSLSGQVDQINIFFNGFESIDKSIFKFPVDIVFEISPINIGDQGKFFWSYLDGYHIICDDDLIYPPDYISKTICGIDRYKRNAVVSYHGRRFNPGQIQNYYTDRKAFVHCLHDWRGDIQLHCPGTGVMAYHSDIFRPQLTDFGTMNMADLWIGKLCQKMKIPIFGLGHKKGWIKMQDVPVTIYETEVKKPEHITKLANQTTWELPKM